MRNKESWKPSKFVYRNGRLSASRDSREVNPSSRLMAGAIAAMYEQHLPTHARGRLIDLGCGDVPLFGAYAAYVADVVCVDWGSTAHKNQYLDYECDLSQPLPFADAEFDTLILSDVLEHIATPDSLWREMARILKPDGIAFVNTPFYYWLHEEPHDYHRYTCFALQRLAERAGFEVILLKALGGSPEVFADLLAKHFIRIPLAGRACAVALQEATRLFVRTKIGRRMSDYSAAKFPFGYFMLARKLG